MFGSVDLESPPLYRRQPGNANRVYSLLCSALAGRHADWLSLKIEDWHLLALMVSQNNEGVGPLMYRYFKERGWPPAAPGRVREALQWTYYQTLAQNSLILEQRSKVLKALIGQGIPALVLKGSAHLERFYSDIGQRPMGDLDLLLPVGDIDAARRLLLDMGYRDEKPELWPGINQESGYHITMTYTRHPNQAINVELHWNLLGGKKSPSTDWFWENKVALETAGGDQIVGLSPTAALLYGAAHLGYKHIGRRERLIWYYDLYQLMTRMQPEVDWDLLLAKAVEFDWVTGIYYALNGVISRFGSAEAFPNAADWAERAELPAYEHFVQSSYSPGAAGFSRLGLFRFPDQLKRSLALLFPSPEYIRWRYKPSPAWSWPLYYPVRVWKWVRRNLLQEKSNRPAAAPSRELAEGGMAGSLFSEQIYAPRLYRRMPGDADRVYRHICRAIIGGETDWADFNPEEWNLLLLMAQPFNEGVGPLLYWTLKQQGWPEAMPALVRRALKKMYYQTFAQNTLILSQRDRILKAFERRGINALVLKGPAFIENLYPDIGLRPTGDLDLLINLEQLDAASRLLQDMGFRRERPDIRPGVFLNSSFQLLIPKNGRREQKLNIELHWRLLNGKKVPDMDWFWDNRTALRQNGGSMLGLNPHAAFLYGAAHLGYKHYGRRERLIWFYDLYLMANSLSGSLDWQDMLDKADRFEWVTGVYYALAGVSRRFGLHDLLPNSRLWEQKANFTAYERYLNRSYSPAGIFFNRLKFFELMPALRLIFSWIFPSAEYMRWRYNPQPGWRLPLYYPYRWVRWLSNYIKSL